MLNHKDPAVQTMIALLEGQRDYAMGTAAALSKEIAELKLQLSELTKQDPTKASVSE